MAATTGNGCHFTLKVVGSSNPAGEFHGFINKVEMPSEDKSDVTFGEVMSGDTKDFTLKFNLTHDLAATSFWTFLYDNPGSDFAFTYGPYGNALPSDDKPHFVGLARATGRPSSATEARPNAKTRDWVEYEMDVLSHTLDRGQ